MAEKSRFVGKSLEPSDQIRVKWYVAITVEVPDTRAARHTEP